MGARPHLKTKYQSKGKVCTGRFKINNFQANCHHASVVRAKTYEGSFVTSYIASAFEHYAYYIFTVYMSTQPPEI